MANQSYHKGKWQAEVDADELTGGKFQGHQIEHRVPDLADTFDGALLEAKSLAHRLLGEL